MRVDYLEPSVADVMGPISAVKDLSACCFLLADIASSLLSALSLPGATRCFLVREVLSFWIHYSTILFSASCSSEYSQSTLTPLKL